MPVTMNSTNVIPLPPEGLNYIAAIHPSLILLMIGTVWTSVLIPIAVGLMLFSTPALRRTPIFLLNLASISLGIAEGILNGYLEITAIISPMTPIRPSAFTAFTCLCFLVPLFVESILMVRLMAVYPPRQTPRCHLAAIFGPLVLFKLVRLVNGGIFIGQWQKTIRTVGNPIQAGQSLWGHQPWTKIEWSVQLVDNTYASILFLLRLNQGKKLATGTRQTTSADRSSHTSYSYRLRTLFWIAVSNFVFPVLLSLAQLIFVARDSSYLDGGYIFLTNNYVEIIGVLLATVWATSKDWVTDERSVSDSGNTASIPKFARIGFPKLGGLQGTDSSRHDTLSVLECSAGEDLGAAGGYGDIALDHSFKGRATGNGGESPPDD